jgi:ankyrin repeat protein
MDNEVFILIKNNKFDDIYNLIKNNKIKDLNIKDTNYNYFIQYIINFNQIKIIELILELQTKNKINIRLDIIDSDGRSILYNCIKYNYIELMKLLINCNKTSIGISIIDIKDSLGLNALHYSVIFNNFDAFKLLLDNEASPYIVSKDKSNVFITCLTYNHDIMLKYLIDQKYNLNFTTSVGETLIQVATNYNNYKIIDLLLETNINLNNKTSDYGLTILHQSIILDNFNLFKKLLDKNLDINLPDFYGNTPLHYIISDKHIKYLALFIKKSDIKFNISNINGELPLHILLEYDEDINIDIMSKFIINTDLNIQNNKGRTCLSMIIEKKLLKKFRNILINKPLNFFIEEIKLNDEILDVLVDSYYNQIKLNKDELVLDWEKWCSVDLFEKLKTLVPNKKTSDEVCKYKIREIIQKEKRTLPKLSNIDLIFDNGIYTNLCYYTGTPIDVLFGLFLLHKMYKENLGIVIDYPLTKNIELENYYQKIGLDYPYKLDFSNIEIIWSYQKIIYPSYFDDEIEKLIKTKKYITIPIGIESSVGSHANILFWDIKNKTIERFEPNGSNYPIGLNYNPELLDELLKTKFKYFEPEIKFYHPYNFLPPIGFQILENLESDKCKKIGDPNGFCAVWCIWWVYQRMQNINTRLTVKTLANELIQYIKFDNHSFKTIIRNFSKKITEIRDIYLSKQNLDINEWIVGNYTSEILNNLEKDIYKNLK